VIAGRFWTTALTATREGTNLYRRFGIQRHSQHPWIRIRFGIDPVNLLEDGVGLGYALEWLAFRNSLGSITQLVELRLQSAFANQRLTGIPFLSDSLVRTSLAVMGV